MIYLAVRLSRNSATAASGFSTPGEADQFWLHPSAQSEEDCQMRLSEEIFDDSRVQWFRSPKIAYVLRDT
jgi:hypothetical protein